MSLILHRRSIRRAIAGELDASAEARLRRHLAGCAPCRDLYDRLSLLAPAADQAKRERGRLEAALFAPARPAPVRLRRAWLLLAVPAVAAVVVLVRPPQPPPGPPAGEVTYRGAGDREPATTDAPALVLYASRKAEAGRAEPPRLVAELPASGEAVVSVRDYLQLACRGARAAGHLVVIARDEAGRVHQLFPGDGGDTRVEAGEGVVPVGPAIDVARLGEGRLRLRAVWSPDPLDVGRLRANEPMAAGPRAVELGGILQVEP